MPLASSDRAAMGLDPSVPAEQRYDIVGRIATGGMAEIYLARTRGNRPWEVVLKRLLPELQSDHEFVQMFQDEANIAQQLDHPNVVQIYELGELDDSLFISMELLRGVNLRDLLARLHAQGEELPIPLALRIFTDCLDALDYAHSFSDARGRPLNVVHRDVSPQNIIVTFDGVVKLVDFGVAKAEGRLHQTRAGLIKGKFAYMSPEQVGGGKVDGRSDIFALAEVFYEILLRRHPFYAPSDMEVLRAIIDNDPPHPSALQSNFPAELGEILMRAMRKAPGDRYATAGRMREAIDRYVGRRSAATQTMVGRYVSDLFADRVELEREAREIEDDDALIDAFVSGRAEMSVFDKSRSQSRPQFTSDSNEPPRESAERSDYGERDRVVEVSHRDAPKDPAEPGVFMAHSGYSQGPRRRFSSQVAGLFDEGSEGAQPVQPSAHDSHDDAEMPTMLGHFSADDMSDLREARAAHVSGGVTVRPSPGARSGPEIRKSPVGVTPRSRTLIPEPEATSPASDKVGLAIFVFGLLALLAAVAYAASLYLGAQTTSAELEMRSHPSGASIWLDGKNTGAKTPHSFRNVVAGEKKTVEFRMAGYESCRREVVPSQAMVEKVSCTLQAME